MNPNAWKRKGPLGLLLLVLAFAAMALLKASGALTWSWLAVTVPLWVPVVALLLVELSCWAFIFVQVWRGRP